MILRKITNPEQEERRAKLAEAKSFGATNFLLQKFFNKINLI